MSDNIFDQLIELFNQPGPVNWKLAAEVAHQMAGQPEPIDPWLADEYQDLARLAELQVSSASGLTITQALTAQPVDRRTWADENLQSFRYLVEPLSSKLSSDLGTAQPFLQPLAPALLGMQMGVMIGFLSNRILGQFDIGMPTADAKALYFVVPNIEDFASSNHLDPKQVRLWIALHEVTHHAEFSVPWVRPRFLEMVTGYIDGLDLQSERLTQRFEAITDPTQMQSLFDDPAGLAGWIGEPGDREALDRIQAFMAFVEGYAEYIMDVAAPNLLPDLDRMRSAVRERRSAPSESEQALNRLLGLELKHEQYELGAEFCRDVARRWGGTKLAKIWESADHLPSLNELADPTAWAARVLLDELEI